jgi:Flp pilus assembly pilin Flp
LNEANVRPEALLVAYFRSTKDRAKSDEGQTLVEYSLLIAMMSVALVGALGIYQGGLAALIEGIIATLTAIFG